MSVRRLHALVSGLPADAAVWTVAAPKPEPLPANVTSIGRTQAAVNLSIAQRYKRKGMG